MDKPQPKSEPTLSLPGAILLIIILVFGLVALFGLLIYLFIWGGQQMGLPTIANIAIFVIISGIFAWLVKRITDTFANLSQHWFPEKHDKNSTE
jgi:membrane protein implicated in regulation of membrane protease activity